MSRDQGPAWLTYAQVVGGPNPTLPIEPERELSDAAWLRWFVGTLPLGVPGNAACAEKLREIADKLEPPGAP